MEKLSGGAVDGSVPLRRPGEIVGIAGLTGSGRDDLLPRIFGSSPRTGGRVSVAGQALKEGRPDLAIGSGVAYLAPDRKTSGGVMNMTARENLTMPNLSAVLEGAAATQEARTARTRSGSSDSASGPAIRTTSRSASSAAATSRRSCSASGSHRPRRCSCSTSRPRASTSGRRRTSTGSCARPRPRAPPS